MRPKPRTRIARWLCLLSLLLIFAASPWKAFSAPAPQALPHLAVLPFQNETAVPSTDAACAAATQVLLLTLRQLGLHETTLVDESQPARDLESLRAWAESHNSDFVMFGQISQGGAGAFACGLSLFDRAKGRISIARRSEGLRALELFDASDELIAAVLNEATGRHIGFGRLVFRAGGEKGGYRVILDGLAAGKDLASLDAVLNGGHSVVVVQKRMLGELELLRRDLDLAEGETVQLSFQIPSVTAAEKERLEGLESLVRSSWENPGAIAQVEAAVADYQALTRDASYSTGILAWQKRAKQLAGEWIVMGNRLEILGKAWEPESELLDPSLGAFLGSRAYPEPEAIRAGTRANASLLATLLELKAARLVSAGDLAAAQASLGSILDFSRYLPEEATASYAFAVSALKDLAAAPGKDSTARAAALFGPRMAAAERFHQLGQIKGGPPILLPSDAGLAIAVEGAEAVAGPQAIPRAAGAVKLAMQGKDGAENKELSLAAGAALVYLDLGIPPFAREKAAPGAGKGRLVLTSEPEGMQVYLDDSPDSIITPGEVELSPGAHRIRLQRTYIDGLYFKGSETQWVTVAEGSSLSLPLPMAPELGLVDTQALPAGLRVFARDKELGVTPFAPVEMQAGMVDLRIETREAKTVKTLVLLLPDQTEVLPWGRAVDMPYPLARRTIKMDGKPDSWGDLAPIYENKYGVAVMGSPDYAMKAIYMCRDEKYLYWRIDYAATNPLDRPPKSRKDSIRASLFCGLPESRNLDISVAYQVERNQMQTWSGISSPGGDWQDLKESFSYALKPDSLVVRYPLKKLAGILAGVKRLEFSTINFEKSKDWNRLDKQVISSIYVDFSQ